MISNNSVNIFFGFLIFFVIAMLIFEVMFYVLQKGKNNNKKIGFFGILMELSDMDILALSVLIIKYLFILWSLFDKSSINIGHLFILIILVVIFGIGSKNIKATFVEFISSFAIYFAFICLRILSGYLIDVRFEWYVLLGKVCLIVFVILYSTFFLIKNINEVALKNKFIRRSRNEEDN